MIRVDIYYNSKNGYKKVMGFDTINNKLKFRFNWLSFKENDKNIIEIKLRKK